MRIVIDLQGAQTSSRLREIGRYSLSLARAIARNRKDHEVMIALNALFPETLAPIRAEFEGLLPGENILVWSIHGPDIRACVTLDTDMGPILRNNRMAPGSHRRHGSKSPAGV